MLRAEDLLGGQHAQGHLPAAALAARQAGRQPQLAVGLDATGVAAQLGRQRTGRADAEGARIRDDARADATRIREELKEQAEAEVERMLQRGREQLVADRDQAVRKLRADLGGASMELAERVIRTTLDDDGARVDTVESFLSEIESLPSPRGSVRATTGGGA